MSEQLPMVPSQLNELDFIKEAGRNVKAKEDEGVIPFVRVMQPLSPQIGTVPNATPGAFVNTATNRVIDGKEGMIVVPITVRWNFTQWVTREQGGGFVKNWGEDEKGWQDLCVDDQKYAYQPTTRNGHAIVRARHFYIFTLDEIGEMEWGLIPFTGTSLKVAKQWTSFLQYAPKLSTSQGMMTPAHFYYTYKVTTEEQKNNMGKWFLPKVSPNIRDGKYVSVMDYPNGKRIWDAAVAFRDSLNSGEIEAMSQDVSRGEDGEATW